MLLRVDPLRRELSTLEKKAHDTKMKGEEMTKIIHELERSITQYKEEYAVLISEANAIKADLATVEAKVGLSVSPLRIFHSNGHSCNNCGLASFVGGEEQGSTG